MNKVILYSLEGSSLSQVLALQQRAIQAGVEVTECAVGQSWDEVLESVGSGEELVVDSLSCFSSLNDLLGFVASRGVRVRSLSEAWFSESPIVDPLNYQCRLYELGSSLHAARTRKGLDQAAKEGRLPGRKSGSKGPVKSDLFSKAALVEVLRVEHRLTVVEACQQAGISVNGYYRKRR